ncbi:MAG: LamG domain-containing protein [Candidatus Eisenbacteria bacterium]
MLWSDGPTDTTRSYAGDRPSRVALYGSRGLLSRPSAGGARAYVRIPSLRDPAILHVYPGSDPAEDAVDVPSPFQISYTRRPDGTRDPSLLLEWLMEDGKGFAVRDETEHHNDGRAQLGGNRWRVGGSPCADNRDVHAAGHVLELAPPDFVGVKELTGPEELNAASVEIWFALQRLRPAQPLLEIGPEGKTDFALLVITDDVFVSLANPTSSSKFSTAHIPLGVWHHLVATYDGELVRVYLDGVRSRRTVRHEGPIPWNGKSLRVGKSSVAELDALVDEVRVYGRALSEEEVRAHYHKISEGEVRIEPVGS